MLGAQIQAYTQGLWLGYHRESSGAAWTWLDNHVNLDNYEKWGPGEPSGYNVSRFANAILVVKMVPCHKHIGYCHTE